MAFSSDDIFGLGATQVVIGASITQFIDVQARQKTLLLKYFSGGTLEIQSAPKGSTQPGSSFTFGTGYIMAVGEAIAIEGPCRFYLLASGTTTTAMLLNGFTNPGFNAARSDGTMA